MHINNPKINIDPVVAKKFKVALVYSSWHVDIVSRLVEGAKKACLEKGVSEENISYFLAPGAYELPQLVDRLARTKNFHAIVPMGCVIRGETNHFEMISNTISAAFDQIGRTHQVVVTLGVITAENIEQAHARSGGNKGNKGIEAAEAAIDLAAEFERLK